MRKLLVFVLCLVPSIAYAQDGPGRWKLGGDGSCYWEGTDGGPNQCEPVVVTQELQDTANEMMAVAMSTAEMCPDAGDDQNVCNHVVEAIATIAASPLVTIPVPAVGVAIDGYLVGCAIYELGNVMYDFLYMQYSGTTDWSYAPQAVVIKMIEVMARMFHL